MPLWLDEGVAQWAEEAKRRHVKAISRQLYREDTLLSLSDMMNLNIRNISDKDGVYIRSTKAKGNKEGVLFLSGNNLVNVFLCPGGFLGGDFWWKKYGGSSFIDFCRQLRDGKGLEEALSSAYSGLVGSLEELEDKWRRHLGEG